MKDAFRQIAGRMISALSGFLVVVIMTPMLGPLRYGDYTTILSYFALWSALSDLGLYVIGLKDIGKLKTKFGINKPEDLDHITPDQKDAFSLAISQFVRARIGQIVIVYTIAILVAYLIPSYAGNPYMARGLPLGMLFSAGFMIAGIVQLPLQLFRKMEQVSIALVLARISQLLILGAIVIFGWRQPVDHANIPLALFLLMVGSVAVSSITQTVYTLRRSNKIIRIRYVPFLKPMRKHIRANGKYGMAFFLSSFHLQIIALMLSVLYPTIDGFKYVGIRGLGLQLIQILLIIPSAIANSLIHKASALSQKMQKIIFGRFLTILVFFGRLCIANFFIFATPIIRLVSGTKYLTPDTGFNRQGLSHIIQSGSRTSIGTDFVIPGLALVLALSFIKTVFNYLFVATDKQNILFPINLIGVIMGGGISLLIVRKYNIIGGIVAQILMEVLFVVGSLAYAKKFNIIPTLYKRDTVLIGVFFITIIGVLLSTDYFSMLSTIPFLITISGLNILIIMIRWKFIIKQFGYITSGLEEINTSS